MPGNEAADIAYYMAGLLQMQLNMGQRFACFRAFCQFRSQAMLDASGITQAGVQRLPQFMCQGGRELAHH